MLIYFIKIFVAVCVCTLPSCFYLVKLFIQMNSEFIYFCFHIVLQISFPNIIITIILFKGVLMES
jgi:hypothetical protein